MSTGLQGMPIDARLRRTAREHVGRRLVAVTVLTVCALLLFAGSAAAATSPWWRLLTLSAPAAQTGGEGEVMFEAADLGEAPASDAAHPVVIEDTLPAGVVPTAAHAEGGGNIGFKEQYEHSSCSISGQQVRCTYGLPVAPYEEVIAVIDVKVTTPGAGSAVNEATVSGGLLAPMSQRQALTLEEVPSYGVDHLELTPEEDGGTLATRAGSHMFQLTSTFALNTQALPIINGLGIPKLSMEPLGLTKDLRFSVPPGLVVNATAMPRCSDYVFFQQVKKVPGVKCPADTAMGVATSIVTENRPVSPEVFLEPLYNLEPAYGEPARFGFGLPLKTPAILDTAVNASGGDTGATVTVKNLTQQGAVIGSQVTFWGWPADPRHDSQRGVCAYEGYVYIQTGQLPSCPLTARAPKPFFLMPTSCAGPLGMTVEADSWEHIGEFVFFQGEPIPALQACNEVPFSPTIKAEASTENASAPSGLSFDIDFNDEGLANPEGIAQSQIEKTVVTLPEGMTINPSAGVGLQGCTETQYNDEALQEASEAERGEGKVCPEQAKLGTVTIESPLISAVIHGNVYIAQPYENPSHSLVALYIVARNPENGILVKLAGKVTPNETTGQLVTTFENVPQLPFDHFNFHFREGAQAPLITPAVCRENTDAYPGVYTAEAQLTPWSAPQAPLTDTAPFEITKGFEGGECPSGGVPPFSPQVISGTQNDRAGSYSPFYLRILRHDNEQELTRFTTVLPPGLTANLTGVPFCPDTGIEAARAREKTPHGGREELEHPSCPVASEIGHTLVGAGVGSVLAWTPGKLYLAGPYHGQALSLVSVTSATVGPFDLGTVVIRFALKINPVTGQAEIDGSGSDPIPHIIDGIVVHVRDIHVYVDRPNFMLNPTNCNEMQVQGAISGAGANASGQGSPTVDASSRFQAADCASLGFKPSFKAFVSGKNSRKKGAGLTVKLAYPRARQGTQANIHSVKVDLPKQLPSRLTTLQKACTDATFATNPAACPAASRVGIAKAITPILPVPLEGPAYFVSHGGAKFPELIIVLQGYGITIDLHGETFISKAGITSSTFRSVPDEPVTSFELTLPQGPDSALAANGDLCKHALKMPTAFTAQNGLVLRQATKIAVTGCPRHRPKGTHHRKRPPKK